MPEIRIRACTECGHLIDRAGFCAVGCRYDSNLRRPAGTVAIRVYGLVREEVEMETRTR